MGIFALFRGWYFQELETFDKFRGIYFYELMANLKKISCENSFHEDFLLRKFLAQSMHSFIYVWRNINMHANIHLKKFELYSNSSISWSVFDGQLVFLSAEVVFKCIRQVCVCLVKGKYTVLQSN